MKLFYLLMELTCAVITCIISGALYLKGEYNMSGLLILSGIFSITLLIKSSGILEDKKPDASATQEVS